VVCFKIKSYSTLNDKWKTYITRKIAAIEKKRGLSLYNKNFKLTLSVKKITSVKPEVNLHCAEKSSYI